jgi:putative Mg2+ transporter-C (MgtC) family protein
MVKSRKNLILLDTTSPPSLASNAGKSFPFHAKVYSIDMMTTSDALLRLALGALFGGAIGFERQVHGRPAGFRTHMLVCIASVLIMEVSEYFHFLEHFDPSYVRVDPSRIAAGAITGVGFLGAGVIVKMGATVQGLTTAACLWMVSAIGLALGAGMFVPSTAAFIMTLFALLALRGVERHTPKPAYKFITVSGGEGLDDPLIKEVLSKHSASLVTSNYERNIDSGETVFQYTVSIRGEEEAKPILDALSSLTDVHRVHVRS